MEFIDLENKDTETTANHTNMQEVSTQTQEPTLQETINNQTCGKPIKPQIEPIMTDRNSIRAETLINLTAHFYKLFKDKGVINRFEPFLKDCKEQAMQRININEMLVFKDLEVPDSDFDSGMGVIPNEPPIIENDTSPETDSQDESTNTEDSTTQEPDTESEVLPPDTEAETDKEDKGETQGSDVIVGTETELKPVWMDRKFLLPTCDIDDSVFCDEIDDVTSYTQAEREEFLQKLGIYAKDFFKDE